MTSIKIKFRPSVVPGKEGSIYFQIIHNRIVRQLNTEYKIHEDEWDADAETVIVNGSRTNHLLAVKEQLEWDAARLEKVVRLLETERRKFSADDVIALFHKHTRLSSFFNFMHDIIVHLNMTGKTRTAETYNATLNSFMAFRNELDIPLEGISSELVQRYQAFLISKGLCMNTISFYMRILRAVHNRAVEKEMIPQRHPFRHVYTGVDKTVKRAIPVKDIKAMKNLDLSMKPPLDFARDMFLFSFYTRGMSFVDMAFLKKNDLQNGVLTYRRRKTGQRLAIKWEKCMEEIIAKYPDNETGHLLPIIKNHGNERKQYVNAMHLVNNRLKTISEILRLPRPLTMYVARHSWASTAKTKNIPLSVISEGMGHDSEATTQIYLASLETTIVDNANKIILDTIIAPES